MGEYIVWTSVFALLVGVTFFVDGEEDNDEPQAVDVTGQGAAAAAQPAAEASVVTAMTEASPEAEAEAAPAPEALSAPEVAAEPEAAVALSEAETEEQPKGAAVVFDGSDLLQGTAAEDLLVAGQDAELAPEAVDLLEGDDVAQVDVPAMPVDGGAGEDRLEALVEGAVLLGGAGNDTLIGAGAVQMDGGAGNDALELDAQVGMDAPGAAGAVLTGGAGADSFALDLALQDSVEDSEGDGILQAQVAKITDFDPDEDALAIALDRAGAGEERDLDIGFEQLEENGVFTTKLTLTFESGPEALEAVSEVMIVSAKPFGLGDITFVGM